VGNNKIITSGSFGTHCIWLYDVRTNQLHLLPSNFGTRRH